MIAGFLNDSLEHLIRECEAQGPGRYVVSDQGGNRFAFDYLGEDCR